METIKFVKGTHTQKTQKPELSKIKVGDLCTGMGLLVSICLIAYFLAMRAFGLHEVLMLRALNFLILLAGIIMTLRIYTNATKDKVEYFKGIRMGLQVTLVAVIPFVIFMYFYLRFDDGFMEIVQRKIGMGEFLTPSLVAWALGVEGISSGAIMSFVAVQYFKKKQESD